MFFKNTDQSSLSELTLFLILLCICMVLYASSGYLKIYALAFKLSGPEAYPIIGNSLVLKERNILTNRVNKAYKLYGPIVRFWIMVFPTFVVLEPEHLQQILSSKKHTDKIYIYKLLHNFLGTGLITSSGEKWQTNRKLLQPTFKINILEKFVATFADSAQCLNEKLMNAPQDLNITKFVNDSVMDILNESVLGVPIFGDKTNVENSPFRQGKVVAPHRMANPWLLFDWIYKLTENATAELNQKKNLDDFTRKMIKKRREALKIDGNPERKSLLDYMLEISAENPEFTEEDIINEACTFMLAGQDSVGAAMAFCFFELAQHQEEQRKCLDEIDSIFGDDDRSPTINDLKEMKYLEMCIKETLRLYPSVPIIARKISEDVQCGKNVLPRGSEIFVIPYATHRLAHIYPDPEKFDPERFTQENIDKRNPYAYLPFSAGPRNCIGHKYAILEMQTVISKVLRNFHLMPVPGKTTIEPLFRITLRSSGGLWVHLEPRNNNESFKNLNIA